MYGQTKVASDTLNQSNDLGKQGYWEFKKKNGKVKSSGRYINDQKIGNWCRYRYKLNGGYWVYFIDYKDGKGWEFEKQFRYMGGISIYKRGKKGYLQPIHIRRH